MTDKDLVTTCEGMGDWLRDLQDDYEAPLPDETEVVRFTIAREDLEVAIQAVLLPYVHAGQVDRATRKVMDLLR